MDTPPQSTPAQALQAPPAPAFIDQTPQKRFSIKKLLLKILLALFLLVALLISIYIFLATPFRVFGSPIKPFVNDQYVFAEQVSYLFQKPLVGDRVIFNPKANQTHTFIGIIVDIKSNAGEEKYTIRSSTKGVPWIVTKNEIKKKIYYPPLDTTTAQAIVAELNQPTPTPTQSQPSPTPDPTAKWRTYTNTELGFSLKYPSDIYVQLVCPADEKNYFYLTKREGGTSSDFQTKDVINMPTCARDSRYELEIKMFDSIPKDIPTTNKYVVITKEEAILDGEKGVKYISRKTNIPSPYPNWYIQTSVSHGNKYFDIYFDEEKAETVLAQILSTFTFIKETLKACQTDKDCSTNETCKAAGPDQQGVTLQKQCWPNDAVTPL